MKKIYSLLFVLLICAGASAQSFRTGYFLDNNIYGYRINPAATTGESFFGFALSNIDLQNSSSLGISSLLYPNGNSLVTGLNSSVDADTFLSTLSKTNGLVLDESLNILSFGIAKENHTSTVELNVRALAGVSLPYEIFEFLKKGGINTNYDISGIYADANAFADLSYGYSRKISDVLSVGGRIHALVSVGSLNLTGNETTLSIGEQEVAINSNLQATSAGLLKLAVENETISLDKTSVGMDNGLGGFGAALDLGAIYKPIDGLEVSLSVIDLGGISRKNNVTAKAVGKSTYKGGNITISGGNVTTDIEDALKGLAEAVKVKDAGATSEFTLLPTTIAAGARYRMPFYEGLSAGVLATIHTGKYTSWYDVRLGATITPAKIISATANAGLTTFGPSFGAALNAHLGPLNLMLGIDSYLGKMAKIKSISVPLNKFQENIHLGIAFSF